MQEFTLHTHNNEQRFDGKVSAKEMLEGAVKKGFKTIGVTNHLIMHKNLRLDREKEPMFFCDFNEAKEVYKRHIEIIEALKDAYDIDIKIGFETDFFQDKDWRVNFEKMLPELKVDYLIGCSHFLKNEDESFICNIYHLKYLEKMPVGDEMHQLVINHYRNIEAAIRSGYFSFLAHLDYCTIFGLGEDERYDECKYRIIEALKETGLPFEINTSGYDRIKRPHPAPWLVEELVKAGCKVVLSDDAHHPDHLGRHFSEAEALLESLRCQNRFTLADLKRP